MSALKFFINKGIILALIATFSSCAKPKVADPRASASAPPITNITGTDNWGGGGTYDPITGGGVTTVDNNLPTGSVSGKVVDSFTGMGISSARVEVMGVRPVIFANTDATGNFIIPNVPQGRQTLLVKKKDYTNLNNSSNIVVNVIAGNTTTLQPINLVQEKASIANGFLKAFDGFIQPRGITLQKPNNDLFVVDVIGAGGFWSFDRAEVKKINSDGGILDNFASKWFSTDLKSIDLLRFLKKATGIAVDAGGSIYVADTGNDSLKKYAPNGKYQSELKKQFKGIFDISVLNSGNIVVSDPGNSRVAILDSTMNVKLDNILGKSATDSIRGITTDALDNIYVIDGGASSGEVIKKFDKNGNKLKVEFGSIGGLEPGYFNSPTDLAIDERNGDIYVVDTGNNRVQRFSSEGVFLSEFGSFGSDTNQFNTPWGVAVDKDGYVYVSDSKNGRIQKFMPGKFGQN
ncbi:MAG: carboxypeptidase regulatory-like domain-containing protein [Candidatus Sericytochromatia bacterium]